MKTVLFIPGFQQDLQTTNYKVTLKAIESRGYATVFVPINWKRTTIDDWVNQVQIIYDQYESENTILAGFSYGAMTALSVAAKRPPSALWIFSLSPYFSEDIPLLKLAWLRNIGKQRTERFWRLSFDALAPAITCNTQLFIGDSEAKKFPDLNYLTKIYNRK